MAQMKVLLQLIMILVLGFSYFLSLDATPLSRSLKLADQELPTQDFVEYYKALMEQRLINHVSSSSSSTAFEEQREGENEEELFIIDHGRMVLESNDYPGTGANNHHDPKPPAGRSYPFLMVMPEGFLSAIDTSYQIKPTCYKVDVDVAYYDGDVHSA